MDLESIGIRPKEEFKYNDFILTFENEIEYENGRYHFSIPWRNIEPRERLLDNHNLAKYRLDRLSSKLFKDQDLKKGYHNVIEQMVNAGIVKEIDRGFNIEPVFLYAP